MKPRASTRRAPGDCTMLAVHPAKARIYLICDNARYRKNKELRA
ncbi:hypothetical protein [Hymenobacter antarcticus]